VNWGLFPGSGVFPGPTQYPGQGTPDAAASEDSSVRLVRLSRAVSETSLSTEVPHGIANLLVYAFDPSISTEIPHGIAGLLVSASDANKVSDTGTHVTTYVRRASDIAQMITLFSEGKVDFNMGYLIWPEDPDNVLENHPLFTGLEALPIAPTNLLRVFEGKIFPQHHKGAVYPGWDLHPSDSLFPSEGEPDIFSFQLTSYPWTVNQPRQTTNINQGLEVGVL
jgi:hypothetical protein